MSNLLFRSLLVSPAILGVALANGASAQDATQGDTLAQINQYVNEGSSLSQVRSVNQLSDVRPTDWAYQALRSLVERYGCIAGYPDGTFRGNRAMTRYEFAAGLNACLDTVNELIASATADLATQEDLLVLQRLQEEFQAELATLRGRVDALEARTAELEANQFSTTTKLTGQALFSLQDEFGTPDTSDDINTTFGGRAQLNLTSSFTGDDQLRIRLRARNLPGSSTYNAGGLEYSGNSRGYDKDGNRTNIDFELNDLWYRFSPTEKSTIVVGPVGVDQETFVASTAWEGGNFFSDYLDGTAIYEQQAQDAGIGGNYQLTENVNFAAGFVSGLNAASDTEQGVFVSNWNAMAQVSATAGDKFEGALAYVHEFASGNGGADGLTGLSLYDGIGTGKAGSLFLVPDGRDADTAPDDYNGATAETIGVSLKYEFSPRFITSFYATHSWANQQSGGSGDAKAYSAGLAFVFPDLFREGNSAGIAVGVPPTIYDASTAANEDTDTPLAVDLFYDFAVSDNITITPGGIVLFNGNGSSTNDTVFVGAVKTQFAF